MKHGLLATVVAAAMLCAAGAAWASETDYLIASWENTMSHFTPYSADDFDLLGFTSFDGVTNGTQALELDLKPGWHQGLVSAGGLDNLPWDADWIMNQLNGATKFRVDVTTCDALMNVPMSSGLILDMGLQGDAGAGWWGRSCQGTLVDAVYSEDIVTETVEFDFTKDASGNPQDAIPTYTPGTGWFEMRLHYNVVGEPENPGIVILDNLRSVKGVFSHYPPTRYLGDFNGSGGLSLPDYPYPNPYDAGDHTVWADHYGESVEWLAPGSYLPESGPLINQAHYTTWADHCSTYGLPWPPWPVPEPASLAMLAIGAAAMLRRRR